MSETTTNAFETNFFNATYYLQNNTDVLSAISLGQFSSALEHFQAFGRYENRSPNAAWDATQYMIDNPDVANAVGAGTMESAWDHFVTFGINENRSSGTFTGTFNAAAYLAANQDVQAAVDDGSFTSAYEHFILYGDGEGRAATNTDGTAISLTPGSTFMLTDSADADTFTGTARNDTFIGNDTTLTVFDSINGGQGTDSLNLVFAGKVTALAVGVAVSSVENVTIQAADEVTADMSSWTGVTNITVTAVTALMDVDIESAASGTVSVTGQSDVDVIDATALTVTVSAGQDVNIDADAATSVSVTTTDDDASEDDLVVVNAAAIATLTLNAAEGTVVTLTTESTALSINAAGMSDTDTSTDRDITVIDASDGAAGIVTDLTVNVTDDSALDLDFALATTLALLGSADLTLAATDLGAVEALTVAGSVGLTGVLSGMGDLESIVSNSTGDIDVTIAATATSVTTGDGDDTITQSAALGATQVINTGAGDDAVVLGADLTAGATVNGGDGTDTISVISAEVGTKASTVISNFEVLEISDALGVNLDVSYFDSLQQVVLAAGSGKATISGLTTGATVTYEAANTADSTLTITNAATGLTDAVNLVLRAAKSSDFDDVLAADVETIGITSTNTTTSSITHTIGLSDDHITLNVSGNAGLIIDTAMTNVETIDASGFDSGLTVDLTGNTSDATITTGAGDDDITVDDADNNISAGDGDNTIVAGDGNNTITGGDSNGAGAVTVGDGNNAITLGDGDWNVVFGDGTNTVVLGAGDDVITFGTGLNIITGGAGADTFTMAVTNLTANNYSTIVDLEDGETITFATAGASAVFTTAAISLAGTASFSDYVNAASLIVASVSGGEVSYFQYGGDTYIVNDNSDNVTFEVGVDEIVKLTGQIDLSGSSFGAGDGTFTYTAV